MNKLTVDCSPDISVAVDSVAPSPDWQHRSLRGADAPRVGVRPPVAELCHGFCYEIDFSCMDSGSGTRCSTRGF
jgi:hypothetical protein